MVDRLRMGPKEVEATAQGVEHIASLPDPVGRRGEMSRLANGLLIGKQRLPLGVIAMIYESRPNVTVDAAALCLKAGNAVILRGGSEAATRISPSVKSCARRRGTRGCPKRRSRSCRRRIARRSMCCCSSTTRSTS